MADVDLPVWTIPPNWSTPVTERLEWLTDVMQSRSLAEQRRALRLTPRRYFEFVINPVDSVRSLFDQWMHRISDERMLLPLWHDRGKLTEAALATDTRIELDTRWMEFEEGGTAVLYGGPFRYEPVAIVSVDDTGIDLDTALINDWPEGTAVFPSRRAIMDIDASLSNLTSRVGESSLTFTVDSANPYTTGIEPLPLVDGTPLVTIEPNRMDALEQTYGRVMGEFDSETGRIRRYDENLRSFQTQFYNWRAVGREQHHRLRQTLYRLKGRQKAVWLPSFNRDIVLADDLTIGEGSVDIQKIGYHILGGPIDGRDRVLIRDNTGANRVIKFDGSADVSEDVERLSLDANSTFNASAGGHGSFLSMVRMDQDVVEITHHTDSEGVSEATAAFRSFSPARAVPSILSNPIPIAAMGNEPCGTMTEVPCPLFFAEFDGWDYEFSREVIFTQRRAISGLYAKRPEEYPGIGQGGAYGSDFSEKFGWDTGLISWDARRFNMTYHLAPSDVWDYSYMGNWRITSDMGLVNMPGKRGHKGDQVQTATINIYWRHWSQPFPGKLVATKVTKENRTWSFDVPVDIDWRDFR